MNVIDKFLTTAQMSAADFAEQVGVAPAFVSQWRTNRRPVPTEHCAAIEKVTKGAITRKHLRPDDWRRIWPELAKTK